MLFATFEAVQNKAKSKDEKTVEWSVKPVDRDIFSETDQPVVDKNYTK